jgi:dihydroorotate dehydrogenase (fumarate)
VLFNRFYQADIDIHTMSVVPSVELSHGSELLLRLRWVAILHRRIAASLVVSGGVSTPEDGIKALLAGADAVQLVSAILRHGPSYFRTMQEGLERWMERQGFTTVDEFRGRLSLQATEDPESFERASYIRVLHNWNG